MTQISVIQGDITKVNADALLTVVNSGGLWFGGIDGAIQRIAGNSFHAQVAAQRPLRDGDAFYTRANGQHRAAFKDVIFVIDDLQQPIKNIVLAGLEMAAEKKLKNITVPTLRTGVMSGVHETHEEALTGLVEAVATYATSDIFESITIVVYSNPSDVEFLTQALNAAKV